MAVLIPCRSRVPPPGGLQGRRAQRAFAVLAGILVSGLSAAQPLNEYQVKAAFLHHFARFVEWPPESGLSDAFAICVLGEDPFGRLLDDAVSGKTIDGRPFTVSRMTEPRDASRCRMLFISASERNHMAALLASVGTVGLLTVGDTPDFVTLGGMIGLKLESERIRLQINLAAAEKAKMRISSRLLSLATIVKR